MRKLICKICTCCQWIKNRNNIQKVPQALQQLGNYILLCSLACKFKYPSHLSTEGIELRMP